MKKGNWKKMLLCCAVAAVFAVGCGAGEQGGQGSQSGDVGGDIGVGDENSSRYPFFREDAGTMRYSASDYADAIAHPYWLGNVIYNEITLPLRTDSGTYASLLYTPERVISVREKSLDGEYEEERDYIVDRENKRLIIPGKSYMETLSAGTQYGEDVPDGYVAGGATGKEYQILNVGKGDILFTEGDLFSERYLSVTYSYDPAEVTDGLFNTFDASVLPSVRAKLERGEDITLGLVGDSITAGNSASGLLGQAPECPPFPQLVQEELETRYGSKVDLVSCARGGTHSGWVLSGEGEAELGRMIGSSPDLVIIAYGMNDATPQITHDADAFAANISAIMDKIKASAPDCEFLLVNSFPANERYAADPQLFAQYAAALSKLENESVKLIDMYTVGTAFLTRKSFPEIGANNVNHPNDFMHRVYAMNILTALVDYAEAGK